MLSTKALKGVSVLAERLASRGIGMESIEETPVSDLVGTTTVITKDEEKPVLDVNATAQLSSSSTGPIPNSHNLDMDDLAKVGQDAVIHVMNTARNVIVPIHEEIVSTCREELERLEVGSTGGYNIIQTGLNPVLKDSNFLALLSEYSEADVIPQNRILRFGEGHCQVLTEMTQTGFKNTDEAIDQLYAKKGEAFFKQVWLDFFHNTMQSDSRDTATKLSKDKDVATVVFLFARKLLEDNRYTESVMETSSLDLTTYREVVAAIRNQAAVILYNQLRNYDNALKAGIVVEAISDKTVLVNEDAYHQYINQGGDVDVLLGLAITKGRETTIAALNEAQERLRKAWYDHAHAIKATAHAERFTTLRYVLSAAFNTALKRADNLDITEQSKAEAIRNFEQALKEVTDTQLSDIETVVLKLLKASGIKDEGSFFILERMQFHKQQNPELNPRELAAYAVIEYVTDWVYGQTRLVNIKH